MGVGESIRGVRWRWLFRSGRTSNSKISTAAIVDKGDLPISDSQFLSPEEMCSAEQSPTAKAPTISVVRPVANGLLLGGGQSVPWWDSSSCSGVSSSSDYECGSRLSWKSGGYHVMGDISSPGRISAVSPASPKSNNGQSDGLLYPGFTEQALLERTWMEMDIHTTHSTAASDTMTAAPPPRLNEPFNQRRLLEEQNGRQQRLAGCLRGMTARNGWRPFRRLPPAPPFRPEYREALPKHSIFHPLCRQYKENTY